MTERLIKRGLCVDHNCFRSSRTKVLSRKLGVEWPNGVSRAVLGTPAVAQPTVCPRRTVILHGYIVESDRRRSVPRARVTREEGYSRLLDRPMHVYGIAGDVTCGNQAKLDLPGLVSCSWGMSRCIHLG